ncbi:MAG TPA: mechanosensitive ion channel [Kiritimatiellia bacterium]|jgi:small conductance mechanosensitive channel|nr:mechanosensitive ion channel [Kiritimatiellia bacterium]HOR98054.1 mechanosensitive ion channel [Kiritimatiellia bacterium]HPW74704.1 mechanosensitive ion channel [Kiritimatiellia bacterium]
MMETIGQKLLDALKLYGVKVLFALGILLVGWFVARMIRQALKNLMRKAHLDDTLVTFLASLSHTAVMILVIITALGQVGLQTTSFVAVLGAAGLAVGLALQGSLSNFAYGILMVLFKPFRAGDYIEGAGVGGLVKAVGIFTTELRSPDNKTIIVPNAKMMGDNIVNYSANATRRLELKICVSFADDLKKAKQVLESVLEAEPRVLKDPAPFVGVFALSDYGVEFTVRPWVKTPEYWDVRFALLEAIKTRLDAEGITIPLPQQVVHLHRNEE